MRLASFLQRPHSALVFLLPAFAGCAAGEEDPVVSFARRDIAAHGYFDPQPVGSYPASEARINGWINAGQIDSIRAHAWNLWQSMTTMVDDSTPTWQTFYSGHELFDLVGPPAADARPRHMRLPLERFRQLNHAFIGAPRAMRSRIPVDPDERVFGFNRYSRSTANYIWDNRLNGSAIIYLTNLLMMADSVPLAAREILVSPDSTDPLSIVTKPVFQFIPGDRPSPIPYWRGYTSADTRTDVMFDTLHPPPRYWKQGVVVDPTGKLQPGDSVFMAPNDSVPPAWLKVVPLSSFYHITVTAADSANLSTFGSTESGDDMGAMADTSGQAVIAAARPGAIGLLMAMHVTGKEIPNWTWQSYWWSPMPNDSLGSDRPASIPAPWNNYVMTTAYSMLTVDNQPNIAFSPYLETSLAGKTEVDSIQWYGVITNCMSCHRRAAVGYWGDSATFEVTAPIYGPAAFVDPGDTIIFTVPSKRANPPVRIPTVKLDFLWSVVIRAAIKPLDQATRTTLRARADSIRQARRGQSGGK
jgi:hypothetical protein